METGGMDKAEHGRRLKQAMSRQGIGRQEAADVAGATPRTVTNWTTGYSMPTARQRQLLRKALGEYDSEGDPVEVAVRASRLTTDRQHSVIGYYLRNLREQDEAEGVGA